MDEDVTIPKWVFSAAAALLVLFVGLTVSLWHVDPAAEEDMKAEIISERPALLVFDDPGCSWCARFKRDIAPAYEESPLMQKAPMQYVQIRDQANIVYRLRSRVTGTPTIVLVDRRGKEVSRTGYPGGGAKAFLSEIEAMLKRVPKEPEPANS
ncbi:MAG: thioredoxin family protein [Hyphomicrobiaceae bacterium]